MSSLCSCNIFQTAVAKANHLSTCHQNLLDIIAVIAARMHDLSSSHAILPPWNQRLTSPLTPDVVGSCLSDWAAGRNAYQRKVWPHWTSRRWPGLQPRQYLVRLLRCFKTSSKIHWVWTGLHSNKIHYPVDVWGRWGRRNCTMLTANFLLSSRLTLTKGKRLYWEVLFGLFDELGNAGVHDIAVLSLYIRSDTLFITRQQHCALMRAVGSHMFNPEHGDFHCLYWKY